MPKHDDDLFTRLRRAGVRKPVAKTLSELTGDAGKKATTAGHKAVAELRALADEIEKRLPAVKSAAVPPPSQPSPVTTPRRRTPRPAAPTAATKPAARRRTTRPAPPTAAAKPAGRRRTTGPAVPTAATKPAARRGAAARPSAAPTSSAPRGENKAKILAALTVGPRTASEIGQETGIATTTVSAALTRLAKAGEVTKATRGYALPS